MNYHVSLQKSSSIMPSTTIIAFDLHRVIIHRSWGAVFRHLMHILHKKELVLFLISPIFWFRVWTVLRRTSVSDDVFERLVVLYPKLAQFEDDFIVLENLQKPDQAVIGVLHDLKRRGFKLYLLSNIGERAYADLSTKLPQVFILFDGKFSPCKENGYKQKPAVDFYHDFFAYAAQRGDAGKQVVFIDDRPKNVAAAVVAGMTAYLFTSAQKLALFLRN